MELIDRGTARDKQLTRYFTGLACKNGHVSQRKVDSGSCCECSRLFTKRWRAADRKPQEGYNPQGKKLPTKEYLNEVLEYRDGSLFWKMRGRSHFDSDKTWKQTNTLFAGKPAGHKHKSNRYLEVRLDGKLYKAHRLIYKMFYGEDPAALVDHIDGNPQNNRIENLRVVSQQKNSQNMKARKNSSSVYKGVSKRSESSWVSTICVDDKNEATLFSNELDAALHYDKRAKELFGEYASLNFK